MPVGYFLSLWQKKYQSFSPIFAFSTNPTTQFRSMENNQHDNERRQQAINHRHNQIEKTKARSKSEREKKKGDQ